MMTRQRIMIIVCLGISLAENKVFAEKQSLDKVLFPNQKKTIRKEIPYKVFSLFHAGNKVVITGSKTGPYGEGELIVYDLDGNKLWEKGGFKNIPHVALAENSDKIIAVYDQNIRGEECNACFDHKGNKLWEKWVTSPGITQSEDGIYGITTMVNGEGHGKFQVFDLLTGLEIPHTIKKQYNYFFAKFIDNRRVALLLQRQEAQRDTALALEVAEQYHKLRKEGKIKEAFDLIRKTKAGWKEPKWTLWFCIYEIPTQSIVIERELTSKNGKTFYTLPFDDNPLRSNDEFFIVVGYNLSLNERKTSGPHVIQVLNSHGELLWEKDDFESIKDIRIMGIYLAVLEEMSIRIFQAKTGEELCYFQSENIQRGRDYIQEAILNQNKIILQVGETNLRVSTFIGFDLNTKNLIPETLDPNAFTLIGKKDKKGILFNLKDRSLLFVQ